MKSSLLLALLMGAVAFLIPFVQFAVVKYTLTNSLRKHSTRLH